jgi:hypothetical protein
MSIGSGGSHSRRELADLKQARDQRKVSKSIQKINAQFSNGSENDELMSRDGIDRVNLGKAIQKIQSQLRSLGDSSS